MYRSHPNMLPILEKWSSKIQAASLQVGSKGSKFLQSTKTGQDGIMEAIQAGLAGRVSLLSSTTQPSKLIPRRKRTPNH